MVFGTYFWNPLFYVDYRNNRGLPVPFMQESLTANAAPISKSTQSINGVYKTIPSQCHIPLVWTSHMAEQSLHQNNLFWQGRFLFVFTERNMDSNASKIVSLHWKNKALLDILNSRSTCKVILKLTGGKDISIQKWHH